MPTKDQVCTFNSKYIHVYLSFTFTDKYWNNAQNQRNFFIEFALQKGFDPLVAVNWTNVQRIEIIKQVKEGVEEREDRDLN